MEKSNKKERPAPKRYYEPESSPIVPVYEWQEDEEGHHFLVQVGTKNVDEEIQLYKDSCDIKIIIDRMNKGDIGTIHMLSQERMYGDVNDFPQDVHPNAYADGLRQLYENQPDSIKEKFPTYELFANFYKNLTEAAIAAMYAPKEEVKQDGEQ